MLNESQVNEPPKDLTSNIIELLPVFQQFVEECKSADPNYVVTAFQELMEKAHPIKQSADYYTRRFDHG